METGDLRSFHLSVVCGQNHTSERRSLWADMGFVCSSIGDGPWIQLGDFNVVRKPEERLVGFNATAALEFNDCQGLVGLDGMPSKGYWFTWSNRRGGLGEICSKLDRVIINAGWMDCFPESEAVFISPRVCDHCPMLVTVYPEVHKRRPFKFFNFWIKDSRFKDELRKSWSMPVGGSVKYILQQKLRRLRSVLRSFNKFHDSHYSNISGRVEEARNALTP